MLTLKDFEKLSTREQNKLIVKYINQLNSNKQMKQSGGGLLDPLIAKSFNPHVKSIVDKYGDEVITGMTIFRVPLSAFLNIAINAISLGQFNKAKGSNGYDAFFHLGLNLTMSSGVKLTLEKTEVVHMETHHTSDKNMEVMTIANVPNATLKELLNNTKKLMGNKFFTYSASSNNCQYFIRDVLLSNGIMIQLILNLSNRIPKIYLKAIHFCGKQQIQLQILRQVLGMLQVYYYNLVLIISLI